MKKQRLVIIVAVFSVIIVAYNAIIDWQLSRFHNLWCKITDWENTADELREKGNVTELYDLLISDETVRIEKEISEYCNKVSSNKIVSGYPLKTYVKIFRIQAKNMITVAENAQANAKEGVYVSWLKYKTENHVSLDNSILLQRASTWLRIVMQLSFLWIVVVCIIKNKRKIWISTCALVCYGISLFTAWPLIYSMEKLLLKFIPLLLDLIWSALVYFAIAKNPCRSNKKINLSSVCLMVLFAVSPVTVGIIDFLADVVHIPLPEFILRYIFEIQDIYILAAVAAKNIILIYEFAVKGNAYKSVSKHEADR